MSPLSSSFQPHNPIIPSTGRPRFIYDTYEMQLPENFRLFDEDEQQIYSERRAQLYRACRDQVVQRRSLKQVGLREWEWAVGEPIESFENAVEAISGTRPQTYAERVKNFTYTYGDDPIMKGRAMWYRKGRGIQVLNKDVSSLTSTEDKNYIPPTQEDFDRPLMPFRQPATQEQGDVEEQNKVTASNFLFSGPSRQQEIQLAQQAGEDRQKITERLGSRRSVVSISSDSDLDSDSDVA